MMVSMPHEAPAGLLDDARVWIREDKGAKHYKVVNPGGPAWEQVCCRVTKDVRGEILQLKKITHEEEPAQLKEAIEGPRSQQTDQASTTKQHSSSSPRSQD